MESWSLYGSGGVTSCGLLGPKWGKEGICIVEGWYQKWEIGYTWGIDHIKDIKGNGG